MTESTPAAERTPALMRAAEENPNAYRDWNTVFMSGRAIEPASVYVSRRTLAAALDVEEMAGALYVSEHPYDTLENWRNHGSPQSKAVYYRLATAVRASILGES